MLILKQLLNYLKMKILYIICKVKMFFHIIKNYNFIQFSLIKILKQDKKFGKILTFNKMIQYI